MTIQQDAFPDSLLDTGQWLCWDEKNRDGEPTKVPIDPTTSAFASATDPETWTDVETAIDATGDHSGLGFVFTDDGPFVGVDLDKCRDPETGAPEDWARDVIINLDSYTEVSPSGTGFHVITTGTLPEDGSRSGNVEMYETARFFTMTGDHVEGTPQTIEPREAALADVHREHIRADADDDPGREATKQSAQTSLDDQELLARARNASNGEKFARLYGGSTAGYDSQSEADMALCSLLAFWTGNDATQMDRLFRDSGLCRPKWDEVHFADGSTYGEKTIERAITGTSDVYEPGGGSTTGAADVDSESPTSSADVPTESRGSTDSPRVAAMETTIDHLERDVDTLRSDLDTLQSTLAAERRERRALERRLDSLERADTTDTGTPSLRQRLLSFL